MIRFAAASLTRFKSKPKCLDRAIAGVCVLAVLVCLAPGALATLESNIVGPDYMTDQEIRPPLASPVTSSAGARVAFIYVVFPGEEPAPGYPSPAFADSVAIGLTHHLFNQSAGMINIGGLRGILWVNSGGPEPATPYNYRAWAPFGLPQNLLRFPNRSAHEVRPIAA